MSDGAIQTARAGEVVPLDRLDMRFSRREWAFARVHRDAIERHFAARLAKQPKLWNGKVLLLREFAFRDRTLEGEYSAVDFASFLAWADWGFPDEQARSCFAMVALQANDDAFLLGVMGPNTVNSGAIYFPAGSPDMSDVDGGMSISRRVRGASLPRRRGLMRMRSRSSRAGTR